MFRNKLNEIAPVLENYFSPGRTAVKKYSYLSDIRKKKWEKVDTPYINEMINFLESENGNLGRRLLVVTDSPNVAIKAMAYAKVHCDEYYEESDTYYGYDCDFDFDEDEEDVSDMVRIIDLSSISSEDKMPINKYLHLISDVSKDDVVIFSGITDENDIKEKIDVICACPAIHVSVHIKPDLLDTWWAHTLLIDYRCEVLKLTTPGMEYYEKCVEALLDNEKIKLPKELSVKKIVQFAYKNKGIELKEEDVAWYMDKLLSKSLNMAAFENPMVKLENMTGLENLKKVAIEMAAISQEELRNEKLGVMHKNMVFVGEPGTGKTTGAKMLAEIMAWDGNSNSKFVVADRRKIIGKYVGHTSPKIAKLFEEADGGVLFVDEAGFFLNTDSGGYVQEAIREFVRYMELYPKVSVIFALYSKEVKAFLDLDCGLTSRINRFVKFDNYSHDELAAITLELIKGNGYKADAKVAEAIRYSIEKMNKDKTSAFGNARGARKLAETAIVMSSIRRLNSKSKSLDIKVEDVKKATERLKVELSDKKNSFGFVNENYEKEKLKYAF